MLLGLAALAYLLRFLQTGGLRHVIYGLLWDHLLLPDELAAEIWRRWTLGSPSDIALLDRLPIFAVAAILTVAAWGLGRLLLPAQAAERLDPLERHAFAVAIGLNVWSLLVLALGLLGLLHATWLLRLAMVAAIAAGVLKHRSWLKSREAVRAVQEPLEPSTRRAIGYFGTLAIPFAVLYLLTAALPPAEFDVREYHLQTPKEWFLDGRVTFQEHNVYGNMPLGAEMQALAAMMWMTGPRAWWWGALAGKVVIASYAWWTALLLFTFGRRYFSARAGAVAALGYISMPWIFHVSTVGLIEGAVALYAWSSIYALCLAWGEYGRSPDEAGERARSPKSPAASSQGDATGDERTGRSLVGMSGFLAGASVATKYPGLVFVAVPLSLAAAWRLRRRVTTWLLFGLMVVAGCGLWLGKNAVLAGNPTYPLLYSVFGGRSWTDEKEQRWQEAHGPPRDTAGRRFSVAQVRSSIENLLWESDKLSPLLIPFALFAVLAPRHRRRMLSALLALVVFDLAIWWLLTHRYDRFFLPLAPVLAMFAGVGADWSSGRWWRWTVYGFVTLATLVNLVVLALGAISGDNRILVPLEKLRVESQMLRVHPAHLYLNRNVPQGWAALLVGEAQPFDLEVPVYWSTCWDDCQLETWFRGRSRDERLEILRQHRISHVFIHWHEIARYRSPGNYGFTEYVTREWVYNELVGAQGLLEPVSVPGGDGLLDPTYGEVFRVVYDSETSGDRPVAAPAGERGD